MESHMKQLQLKDFLQYQFLSNLTVSPDGAHRAMIVSICDEPNNTYKNHIYVDDQKYTQQGNEQHLLWDDDNTLLYASLHEDQDKQAIERGEERTVFYRMSIHGGEGQRAFTIPFHVISIKQVTKGEYILLVDYSLDYSKMYQMNEAQKQELCAQKKDMEDYEVIDELPFYRNGQGYTNNHRNTLFYYHEKTKKLVRISRRLYHVESFDIDGRTVYYSGSTFQTKSSLTHSIYTYDLDTRQRKEVLKEDVFGIRDIVVWDHRLLVMATDYAHYGLNQNSEFYWLDESHHSLQLMAHYDQALGSSVGSDCRYGQGAYQVIGDRFYFITTILNSSHIYALDLDGTITPIYTQEGSVDCIAIQQDAIVFIGLQNGRLQEVYACDRQGKQVCQLSQYNEWVFEEKDIRPYYPIEFTRNGQVLYGWVLTPRDYDPNRRYPGILDIHGGPKTVYGPVFYHEMQVWANLGYFVFFMNPTGSDGRGNNFMDIRGQYGTDDYEDLMAFTDTVLKTFDSLDPNRLGVTGGSYGGFMTNWIIGHTHRFKVAASQRSIANWTSFVNTSDIGENFALDQVQASLWTNVEKLWWHSPIKYMDQCTTPTLFIHANEDYRCPYSEGLQMVSSLMQRGVEARLVMFKQENHELSRSGKPKHRIKRLEEITQWMESHLK